ncbi:MAG: hypothetical protein JW862_08525 [Anaerolineales bacterium]|nr:hypothetical protein [Anaerolineales bacterium]
MTSFDSTTRRVYNQGMRRFFVISLVVVSLWLVGCSLLGWQAPAGGQPGTQVVSSSSLPTPSYTASASPTLPTATVTPAPVPSATPIPLPAEQSATGPPGYDFSLRLHPEGGLYVGDQVSLELIAPSDLDLRDSRLEAQFGADGQQVSETGFGGFGIGRRQQATLIWAWDTTGLQPGDYEITLSVQPQALTWSETVSLASAEQLPPPGPQAHWAHAESDCCLFYYVTGTAAERDLESILAIADTQAGRAVSSLSMEFEAPIEVMLLPRVLGHGGFAAGEVAISCLDRHYVGNSLAMVLHHEMIHILDGRLGGDLRPSMLVEGLAVYLTGGHYQPEPLLPRAAALLPPQAESDPLHLGLYVPVVELADDFYHAQHELGYLQAGALVEFMVQSWGWTAFNDFYRDIHPQGEYQSAAIDVALQAHFGLTLAQLEVRFLEALAQQALTPTMAEDVRLTVAYYDTVRRYQQLLDPSAYFLTAWLLHGPTMREKGIVADYLRHPAAPVNLALETLLLAAGSDQQAGAYERAWRAIQAVNAALDALQAGQPEPFQVDPLAQAYWSLVAAVLAQGYEPHRIELQANQARVLASAGSSDLLTLTLTNTGSAWVLLSSSH